MTDIDRFRRDAEEAQKQSERAISPLDKEAWLRVAGEWLKLAQAAEERLHFCARRFAYQATTGHFKNTASWIRNALAPI